MHIEFTGRQFTIPAKLRTMAQERLDDIEQLIGKESTGHVVLTEDKFRKIAEVIVQCKTCNELTAKCEDKDMERALHDALMKVEKQVLRTVKKTVTKRRHPDQTAEGSVRLQTSDDDLHAQPGIAARKRVTAQKPVGDRTQKAYIHAV